ncbi:MAG: NifB/NifX family molybdenum-iron cluster-binding protein [Lentisphaeria bacterium]|nr:NifB/NifX family molybdenum-iron cluster-binding protein [Lentisphaeria bacterium]
MKIAVTCENNEVFQHFGHTPGFAVFEVEGGKIVSEKQISSGDSGHGALAGLLAEEKVDVLICGGIGAGAINALGVAGISVVGGAEGNVREAAAAFVDGTLQVRADFHCNHHHHSEGHSCGGHTCGNGSCSH